MGFDALHLHLRHPPPFFLAPHSSLQETSSQLEPILRPLHAKLGPIVTLRIGPRPAIFIADRSLAHQALVQKGAPPATILRVISTDQHTINPSFYGPTWRLLRRNLTSEILNPSRVRSYGHARRWVLHFLITRFELLSKSGKPVTVAMFWVLVIMCLGEKLDEEKVKDIEQVERSFLKRRGSLMKLRLLSLCNEFINAGTDTTLTALHTHISKRSCALEIKEVVGDGEDQEVKEEYLQNLPYLKAEILEGLRRHPPGHFVAPHAVTQDVVLDKYVIPKNATINFMVAEMGWDPKVWKDPMSFKPERFVNNGGEAFDITGSREIKMMPFGAGRRICPAYGLATLHLEYFGANSIWKF
ncbi:hypothetical protein Tsubulata_041441, partial [Turnera subulata]